MTMVTSFLSGVLVMGYATASLFFLRFWKESRDSLFAYFSAAFLLLAVGRTLLNIVRPAEVLYATRIAAFLLIILAIVGKNRES